MYGPYPYPWPMPHPAGDDGVKTYKRFKKFLAALQKEEEENKKKKKKPELPKVSLPSAVLLAMSVGPILGLAYGYAMILGYRHLLEMVSSLPK